MKSNGRIIYLETSVDTQLNRTRRDKKRPLLQTDNRREKLELLAKERNPLYEDLADITVCTDSRTIHQSLSLIVEQLSKE